MARITNAVASHKRKKRVLKQAKGQFGHRSKHYSQAIRSVIKGMAYEYRDRKVKKREFRRLWILRINAACRENGVPYNRFIKGLADANVEINRKLIAELAVSSPVAFKKLLKMATGVEAKETKSAKEVEKPAVAKSTAKKTTKSTKAATKTTNPAVKTKKKITKAAK